MLRPQVPLDSFELIQSLFVNLDCFSLQKVQSLRKPELELAAVEIERPTQIDDEFFDFALLVKIFDIVFLALNFEFEQVVVGGLSDFFNIDSFSD